MNINKKATGHWNQFENEPLIMDYAEYSAGAEKFPQWRSE